MYCIVLYIVDTYMYMTCLTDLWLTIPFPFFQSCPYDLLTYLPTYLLTVLYMQHIYLSIYLSIANKKKHSDMI